MRPTLSTNPILSVLRSTPSRSTITRRILFRNNAVRHNSASATSPSSSASTAATKATQQASAAAAKASQQASAAAAKASEGLQAISAKAGPFLMGVLGTVGKMGGRTGQLVKKVEALVPPTIYYSKVIAELSKLVFHARQMSPPPMATFQTYYKSLLNNPQMRKIPTVESIRAKMNDRAVMTNGGIIVAELLGFFTVGEMIGRRKIVGYRGKIEGTHH